MAEITIHVPGGQVRRVVDALCEVGAYPGDPEDEPARREFARAMIRSYVRDTVLQYERLKAAKVAESQVPLVTPVEVE